MTGRPLLFVTVIGIAAVPFVVFGLFCAGLFGKAVMLAWVGRRVTGGHATGPLSQPAVAVLIGGVLVLVLYLSLAVAGLDSSGLRLTTINRPGMTRSPVPWSCAWRKAHPWYNWGHEFP